MSKPLDIAGPLRQSWLQSALLPIAASRHQAVLCNMSVEAGATSGIVPGDAETLRYLREEAHVRDDVVEMVLPDANAVYERDRG